MAYKIMTVEDWISVEDNPIQRDTEAHAAKAKHLKKPHETHAYVYAAELPSGKLIKLDGHTRALLWKRKEVEAPKKLFVAVIPVKDRTAAAAVYKNFDSREAMETMRDKVFGAFRRHGFEPKSSLLKYGGLTSALRIAYRVLKDRRSAGAANGLTQSEAAKADIYAIIDEFSLELHALDAFGLGQGRLSAGVIAAFLLSHRKYADEILPFWVSVIANKGSKIDGQMDAVQAVCEMIMARRGNQSGAAAYELAGRCLTAVEKWRRDAYLFRIPAPLDLGAYFDGGAPRPRERLIKAADIRASLA